MSQTAPVPAPAPAPAQSSSSLSLKRKIIDLSDEDVDEDNTQNASKKSDEIDLATQHFEELDKQAFSSSSSFKSSSQWYFSDDESDESDQELVSPFQQMSTVQKQPFFDNSFVFELSSFAKKTEFTHPFQDAPEEFQKWKPYHDQDVVDERFFQHQHKQQTKKNKLLLRIVGLSDSQNWSLFSESHLRDVASKQWIPSIEELRSLFSDLGMKLTSSSWYSSHCPSTAELYSKTNEVFDQVDRRVDRVSRIVDILFTCFRKHVDSARFVNRDHYLHFILCLCAWKPLFQKRSSILQQIVFLLISSCPEKQEPDAEILASCMSFFIHHVQMHSFILHNLYQPEVNCSFYHKVFKLVALSSLKNLYKTASVSNQEDLVEALKNKVFPVFPLEKQHLHHLSFVRYLQILFQREENPIHMQLLYDIVDRFKSKISVFSQGEANFAQWYFDYVLNQIRLYSCVLSRK